MKNWILSIISALLLSIGWLGFSGVTLLVAIVPLLIISARAGSSKRDFWRLFGWTALSFGLWSGSTTWWIWYAAPIGAIASVIISITLMGTPIMLYHYISKRAPKAIAYLVLVCGWVAMEQLYMNGELSFPWLVWGNGFANDTALVQWYEYTGAYGGTLWAMICNVLIFEAWASSRKRTKTVVATVAVVVPVVISLTMFWSYKETGKELTIEVVQPNIDPYEEKFTLDQQSQTSTLVRMACQAPTNVDYIIMPETAVDDRLWENDIKQNPAIETFQRIVREKYPQASVVVGATTFREYTDDDKSKTARSLSEGYWYDVYNSAMVIDSAGLQDIHHKSKLVVGVERMPFMALMKYLDFLIVDLGGTTGQLGYDTVRKVFVSPTGVRSGTAICYESIYGEYFTEFVREGAEIIFIITNDGWWRDTPGYRQHFSFARLRAIETRRSIARSANTGISGFITSRGDVLQKTKWDEQIAITNRLKTVSKQTFYVQYGDYIASLSSYIFVLTTLYYFAAYRIRKKNHLI